MALIVLGHNAAFAQLSGAATAFIFRFHVPAFFFISGYLLQPGATLPSSQLWFLPALFVALLLAGALARGWGESPGPFDAGLARLRRVEP